MLEATEKLFPLVKKEKIFFNDAGARMQKLEGEIGLRMFQWALSEEVPMLSVHDVYAVKEKDEVRTKEIMRKEWKEVINKEKREIRRFNLLRVDPPEILIDVLEFPFNIPLFTYTISVG